jgi:hypothetical protein
MDSLPDDCRSYTTQLEPESQFNQFPQMMIHSHWGRVVLFTSETTGVVVEQGRGKRPVGYFTTHWMSSFYRPFAGSVTISNHIPL